MVWLPKHLPQLWREVASADIVHTPIPGEVGGLAMLLAYLAGKRILVRYCGTWNRSKTLTERLTKRFLEMVAGGRVVVLATGGGPTAPSPANLAIQWIFSASLTAAKIRQLRPTQARRPHSPVRLVVAMRLEPSKNTSVAIEAVVELRRRGRGTAATLDILGDGSERARLENLCQRLNVGDAVRFHGKVPQAAVVEALTQMDIFCFPSSASEGFPKAVFEALAAGVPVVSTGVSVLDRLIHPGIGRKIDIPDAAHVADAVEDLINDPARFAAIAAQAHENSRRYSIENWRDMIAAALEEQWVGSRNPTHDTVDAVT
jgi:glycosyltransferase involved in cell wall biosynthesis